MYEIKTANRHLSCEACGGRIEAGLHYAVSDSSGLEHCGRCAIRSGAAELRATIESIHDRARRA